MIKIIREGTRRITTCKSCGCLFSYEAEDINNIRDHIPPDQPFHVQGIYVICPQCKEECIIAQTK